MTKVSEDVTVYRKKIEKIDEKILRLISERLNYAKKIGEYKFKKNLPIKDFSVEKNVIARGKVIAKEVGLYSELAEEILKTLIHYSVEAQSNYSKRRRTRSKNALKNESVFIVGGGGVMGKWFAHFFDSLGYTVSVFDTDKKLQSPYKVERELISGADGKDYVVLATPITTTSKVITKLVAEKLGSPFIFDICSLKTPIISSIKKAQDAGLQITSIHPMFGPDTELLYGRNVLLCEIGDPKLTDRAESLFRDSSASLLRIPIEKHDELMSYVLGLSHLLNLVFAKTLSASSFTFKTLCNVASATFKSQLSVTTPVVCENKDLYFDIQAENSYSKDLLKSFAKELQKYSEAIRRKDRSTFKNYMEESRCYFESK